jgi:lipopolysaccharide export system permease protein
MKIFDRYIYRELMTPFIVSLGALCFIMFTKEMLRLVELLVSKGVGIMAVLNILAHLMPSFLVLTLPIACLISSITAFSRLSYDNEIIAMRAAGVSLLHLARPVLVFSFLVFLLTMYLSQWGQPWSNVSLKQLAISLIQDQLTLALDKGVFNEPTKGLIIYVPEPKAGNKAKGIFIADQRDPSKSLIVTANTFSMLQDPKHKQLGFRLFDGTIHAVSQSMTEHHQVTFGTYDLKMDFPSSFDVAYTERRGYDYLVDKLDKSGWRDKSSLRRLMEYYKDLGFPVATLILGMLGLPVGIVSKRSGGIGGFAVGILIMVGFFLLNVVGEFFVTTLILHPFAGAWFPNVILLLITIILFYRVSQH